MTVFFGRCKVLISYENFLFTIWPLVELVTPARGWKVCSCLVKQKVVTSQRSTREGWFSFLGGSNIVHYNTTGKELIMVFVGIIVVVIIICSIAVLYRYEVKHAPIACMRCEVKGRTVLIQRGQRCTQCGYGPKQ